MIFFPSKIIQRKFLPKLRAVPCEGGRVTSDVSMGVVVGSLDIILIAHYVLPTITRLIHDQARESQHHRPHAANGEDKYINDRTLVQHQHYSGEILSATLLFMMRGSFCIDILLSIHSAA